MINKIKELYNTVEEQYQEADKYISRIIDDSLEDATIYIENIFNDNTSDELEDPVLIQIRKLDNALSSLEKDSDWEQKLIFVATSLGHLNEKITNLLCTHYIVNHSQNYSQAKKINALKDFIPKVIINDLHFINSFRNSILHANDHGYNLFALDDVLKKKLFSEANTALVKFEYIYTTLR